MPSELIAEGSFVRLKSGTEGWVKGQIVEYFDVIPSVGGVIYTGPGYKVHVLEGKHKGQTIQLPANYVEPYVPAKTREPLYPHIPKRNEPLFPHVPRGQQPRRLPQTSDRERVLPFAGFKDNELSWVGKFADKTLSVRVKNFVSTPRLITEAAFKRSRATLANIITNRELPLAAAEKGQVWWLATIDNLPVEVHVTDIEMLGERALQDMFNDSVAVITEGIQATPPELAERVRELWNKACKWEKIPPDSKFVVFSDDNPFVREYNEAVGQLFRYRQFRTGEWQPATTIQYLASTEGDPKGRPRKFCCRQCGECAPPELLEEGRFPDRISWLRSHYKEKHPSMWRKRLPMTMVEGGELVPPQYRDLTGWVSEPLPKEAE